MRRVNSSRSIGRHNIPSVGLFVWRLRSYSVTETPACCLEEIGPHFFTFSVLGNDAPLFTRPEAEADPTHIAGELNLPSPIRRRAFETTCVIGGATRKCASADYYGEGKSVTIMVGKEVKPAARRRGAHKEDVKLEMVPRESVIVADLTDWQYRPRRGTVVVDPALGRIAFPLDELPKRGVWVSYHYGFSANLGGGEYERPLSQPRKYSLYRVGKDAEFKKIAEALAKRANDAQEEDAPQHAVIEITDSGVYVEQLSVGLQANQSLQLRAANGARPVIRLLDWQTERPDSLVVSGGANSRFTLDGLLIAGRSVQINGDLSQCTIRHSTLVPGWTVDYDCEPRRPAEPSLEILAPDVRVNIAHSIIGSIQVRPNIQTGEAKRPRDAKAEQEAAIARCIGIGAGVRLDPIKIHIH